MKKSEDTKAILARREAFVSKVLSKEETEKVKGGEHNSFWCLFICLQAGEPTGPDNPFEPVLSEPIKQQR